MNRRNLGSSVALAASLLLAAQFATGTSRAAEPKNYAYLYVQGKIDDPAGNRSLAGATVRLTSGEQAYEAATNDRGTFVFEKLPVNSYEMEVRTADGRVIRSILKVRDDPDRTSLKVRFGYGTPIKTLIEPAERKLDVTVPNPPVKWNRFWKQLVIFVGAAGLLAL